MIGGRTRPRCLEDSRLGAQERIRGLRADAVAAHSFSITLREKNEEKTRADFVVQVQ